jgi:hypothetical protein
MKISTENDGLELSRVAHLILVMIWLFSLGMIFVFHTTTEGTFPNTLLGWVVYLEIFWLFPLSIAVISTWGIVQQKNTIITDDKIVQASFSGIVTIEWGKITKIERKSAGVIWIYSKNKKIVISQLLYQNPEKLFEFIKNKAQSLKNGG